MKEFAAMLLTNGLLVFGLFGCGFFLKVLLLKGIRESLCRKQNKCW